MREFSPARKATLQTQTGQSDRVLAALIVALVFFGLVMITNASAPQAQAAFQDKFYYAKQQALWVLLALLGFVIASQIHFKLWQKISFPLFVISVLFVAATFIPGIGIKLLGARRWLGVGDFVFQPAEFAKLALVIFSADQLSRQEKKLLPFLLAVGTIAILVIGQPDFGTSVVLVATSFLMFFAAGIPLFYFVATAIVALGLGVLLLLIAPYRRDRLASFLTGSDPLGSSYHIRQVLLALGSGGLFGVGIGHSRQKYLFLPEATTDSIFAIIAEEFGFIGASFLIGVFVFVILRILKIAAEAPDDFSGLLCAGIASWIGVQAMLNLSSMTALTPLTGVPLPLISYGGSSLLVAMFAFGIVINISKYKRIGK